MIVLVYYHAQCYNSHTNNNSVCINNRKIFVSRRLDLRKEVTIELKRAAVVKNIMGGKM